uniref:Cystatin WCPI-3 (Fragments) n=1 Tax=Wisteria floribunda TaxID=3922 RepID=CYT3_WISFL|nr:RecName: Full=Cystatin WCPI-3 [Wisteria floribunda]
YGNTGGYTPVPDIDDIHVVEIANYAVTEYNKKSGVVAGVNYRFVLK